jgi:hypothetical protein
MENAGVIPCRLFVIPARDAPVAAVLRRGPSSWYQVLRWDTSSDEVSDGAWFRGRIYEDKCDLSPDGELFVYFCHGGRSRPVYTDSWTAVSRLPWLSALALWPSGTTYGGGGRFADDRTLILRNGKHDRPHPDHLPQGLELIDGEAALHVSAGEVEDAQWSGFDHKQRVIFARAGKLYRRTKGRDREVVDLNGRAPEPVAPPEWATRPIGRRRREG